MSAVAKTIVGVMVGITAAAGLANADTTYQNTGTGSISQFGSPDTTSYGEVFTLSSAMTLSAWDFYALQGSAAGNLDLVISAWNGSTAAGSPLYTSSNFAYAGGAEALAFTGINTTLAAGDYIAYATVAGVSNPVLACASPACTALSTSTGTGTIGDGLVYANTTGASPQGSNSWSPSSSGLNLQFTADFKPLTAPEIDPASAVSGLTLLLGGLVVLRGRRSVSVAA